MKIHNVKQQSDEWFEIRDLKMTSSKAQAIGNNSTGLKTYCKELVMNHYCNNRDNYSSAAMNRGNELEPTARTRYMIETGNIVEEVGFVEYNDYYGASTDGLVGDEGVIEIKCMENKAYFDFLLNRKIKSDWVWQQQGELLATGRKWNDFVAYNPNFDIDIVIIRVERNDKMIRDIELGIETGEKMIKSIIQEYERKSKK